MNKISIEDKIKQQRQAFDYHRPPKDLWSAIEKNLPLDEKKSNIISLRKSHLAFAASFLLILVIGAGYFLKPKTSTYQPLIEAESYYQGRINANYENLKSKNLVSEELEHELKMLQQIEDELKNEVEISYGPEKEKMLSRLIKNYRTKLEILELINEKKYQKNKNEKVINI
jgi:hypothetical protein